MKPIYLLLLLNFTALFAESDISIQLENNVLTIENSVIRREYNTLENFTPVSFYQKNMYQNLIVQPMENWFRFVIDGDTVENAQYQSHAIRQLANGGIDLVVRLQHGDYILHYTLRMFPHSGLTCEQMNIRPSEKDITFSPLGENDMYRFPIYNLAQATNTQEINLAVWNGEQSPNMDPSAFPGGRSENGENTPGTNLSQCHMYHPRFIPGEQSSTPVKGPVLIANTENNTGWLIAYEHGSPDNDQQRDFLNITLSIHPPHATQASVKAVRGVFTEHEIFTPQKPLQTEWILMGVYEGAQFENGERLLWNYLYKWQSAKTASRIPMIYYNTWGWQRDDQQEYLYLNNVKDKRTGTDIYGDATVYPPLTYTSIRGEGGDRKTLSPRDVLRDRDRLLKEIDYAHECGADVFVLDDGWFDWMGDWNVDYHFDKELKPIRERLYQYDMRLGLWMAPMCAHKSSKTYGKHPEFMAKDSTGNGIKAGWDREMTCLVSDYEPYFIEKCKHLIDMGCTYFKWDGLDGQYCYAENHHHGGPEDTPEERAERYGYEFINSITRMARALTDYYPDLIIVYDVTEKGRNVGLKFLSQGRYFWMNNGASAYDDLSTYRTKSMRTVPSLYHSIIPSVLQTWAVYPHNNTPFHAGQYNLYSAVLGGNGIWGDLSEMDDAERKACGQFFKNYKRISRTAAAVRPRVTGKIGSSPEIYEQIDPDSAEGQIIAFSGSIMSQTFQTRRIKTAKFLGVLGHAFHMPGIFSNPTMSESRLEFSFDFTEPDAALHAFILGGNTLGAFVGRSTCWLQNIEIANDSTLLIGTGAAGTVNVYWPDALGPYTVRGAMESGSVHTGTGTVIELNITEPTAFTISKE